MPMTLDGSTGIILPTWTSSTRPSSPSAGQMGFNSTTGYLEWYSTVSAAWVSISGSDGGGGETFSPFLLMGA